MNDNPVKILPLEGDLMGDIDGPEEGCDAVVVVCAHLLGSVHVVDDGMYELDEDLILDEACFAHVAPQRPLKESVLLV